MYESEYGTLQNKVESLWIRVNDRTRLVGSRTIAIFNTVAEADTGILNRIYGHRMVSLRMVGISTTTSLTVMLLTLIVMESLSPLWHMAPTPPRTREIEGLVAVILIALATPAFVSTARIAIVPSVLPVGFCVAWWLMALLSHDSKASWSLEISSAALLSLTSDVIVTTLIRGSIKTLRKELKVWRIVAILVLQLCCIPLFFAVPAVWGFFLDKERTKHIHGSLSLILYLLSCMNITTMLLSLGFIASLAFVIVSRLSWPILERLLYPIADLKVIRNRKLMGGLALVCFSYAFNLTSGLLKGLMDVAAK
jgi:hypothetical protein